LVIQTGVNGGTMHAANTTLRAQKPLFTVKFQYQEQNEHEKSLGNALLVKKGAKYISGNDYESALNYIVTYQKPKTSLFD
jgi:DNA processing protein